MLKLWLFAATEKVQSLSESVWGKLRIAASTESFVALAAGTVNPERRRGFSSLAAQTCFRLNSLGAASSGLSLSSHEFSFFPSPRYELRSTGTIIAEKSFHT